MRLSLLPLLLLAATGACAHDLWLEVRPATNGPAAVVVGSGHYFPASENALADRLVHRLQVRRPDGREESVPTATRGKQREGTLAIDAPGLHVLTLEVKNPQLEQPEWWARALVAVAGSNPAAYPAAAVGLEIVPLGEWAVPRVGDRMRLEIREAGQPIEGKIQVVPEGSRPEWLTARAGAPATLTLRRPGRYLLTFAKGGPTCSLTFRAAP
jgi:uncharacterized GH25 family protein